MVNLRVIYRDELPSIFSTFFSCECCSFFVVGPGFHVFIHHILICIGIRRKYRSVRKIKLYCPNIITYITVNKDGIFIGGKPAKTYRCHNIWLIEDTNEGFARLQAKHPDLIEVHAMTSKTTGRYRTTGNPVVEHGPTVWGRAKFVDGYIGPWVFIETRNYENECYAAQECSEGT